MSGRPVGSASGSFVLSYTASRSSGGSSPSGIWRTTATTTAASSSGAAVLDDLVERLVQLSRHFSRLKWRSDWSCYDLYAV